MLGVQKKKVKEIAATKMLVKKNGVELKWLKKKWGEKFWG